MPTIVVDLDDRHARDVDRRGDADRLPERARRRRQPAAVRRWGVDLRSWRGPGRLELTPFGRHHSIRLMRSADGSLRGWYVNLQATLTESPLGFDTTDWQLDVWMPQGGEAEWKDENDLERALELGIMSAEEEGDSHARRDSACSMSGRSRPAGRTGAPTRTGLYPRFRRTGMWSEGEVICVRQTWLGRVWQAHAWYVVKDGKTSSCSSRRSAPRRGSPASPSRTTTGR